MTLTAVFREEKQTKNKIRFEEVVGENETELIGTLYVPKAVLERMGHKPGGTIKINLVAGE